MTECVVVHQAQTATVVVEVLRTHVVTVQAPASTVVQTPEGAPAVVQQGGTTLAQGMQPGALVVQPVVQTAVVAVGVQGAPGAQGIPGPAGGSALQRLAGPVLSALQVVWEDEHGRVWPLDCTDLEHIFSLLGITLTAADAGQLVNVQRSGVLDDTAWSWTPGQRVYLGLAGQLTHTPVEDGAHVLMGTAVSATRLNLFLQDPVLPALDETEGVAP